jgi:hypothetical protein
VVVAIDSENIRLRNLRIRASGAAGVLTDSDPSTTSMQNLVYLDWDDTVCRHSSAPGYKLAALWGPSDDPFGAGWQYPDTPADPT